MKRGSLYFNKDDICGLVRQNKNPLSDLENNSTGFNKREKNVLKRFRGNGEVYHSGKEFAWKLEEMTDKEFEEAVLERSFGAGNLF